LLDSLLDFLNSARSKSSTKASRSSSDMRSQSSPRSADLRRNCASPNRIRSSRLRVLREGQQGSPLAGGWQLPPNGNHLLII